MTRIIRNIHIRHGELLKNLSNWEYVLVSLIRSVYLKARPASQIPISTIVLRSLRQLTWASYPCRIHAGVRCAHVPAPVINPIERRKKPPAPPYNMYNIAAYVLLFSFHVMKSYPRWNWSNPAKLASPRPRPQKKNWGSVKG